jgi:hypothetical protein
MDLIALVQGFMAAKKKQFREDLANKYGIPADEVAGIVDPFLNDTYNRAEELAKAIYCKKHPVLLFIGRKDCAICQRCQPDLERFLLDHKDLELVNLDYSLPEGLLYHMIQQKDNGMLPLIAMIFQGSIKMIFTGECVHAAVYEKFYNHLRTECRQKI